jgi:hypothetical protein
MNVEQVIDEAVTSARAARLAEGRANEFIVTRHDQ